MHWIWTVFCARAKRCASISPRAAKMTTEAVAEAAIEVAEEIGDVAEEEEAANEVEEVEAVEDLMVRTNFVINPNLKINVFSLCRWIRWRWRRRRKSRTFRPWIVR